MIPIPAFVWQIVGGVAIIAGGYYALSTRIELSQARDDLRECKAFTMSLNRSLLTQNVQVDTWKAAASQAQAQGAQAWQKAATVTASHAAELERLRVATPATCADAVRQVRDGLKL